jgi:hypothetical protein
MSDLEQRMAAVETRLENDFALDSRLTSIEADLRKAKSSSLRDWVQTLGPYFAGIIVAVIGFALKDSVTLALQREQLDLEYVKQMRDLIRDFDEADTQAAADANAVGLAMYGRHAIIPLVERLEGGDIARIAAERGLRLVGNLDPVNACPRFLGVVDDRARRFRWQTQKTMIRVLGQSGCLEARDSLRRRRAELAALGSSPEALETYARRYASKLGFDAESVDGLIRQIEQSLEILDAMAAP